MGTRGILGFRKNGLDKLAYNHFDSYPEELGANVVKFCRATSIGIQPHARHGFYFSRAEIPTDGTNHNIMVARNIERSYG